MKKRIINYRLKIDNLLANHDKISKEEWKKILQEHLTQIAFFQHERLVHLIVTVTFAILTMMSIIASIMISNPMLLVLTLLFLVLLVPYIMHYYTLENEVQKMYTCIFRKNRALAPHERSAVPLGTDHCPVG